MHPVLVILYIIYTTFTPYISSIASKTLEMLLVFYRSLALTTSITILLLLAGDQFLYGTGNDPPAVLALTRA